MAAPPTPEELGPILPAEEALGESAPLDSPDEPYGDEDAAFMAAAQAAVGSNAKATALKDAIEACLRSHGLLDDASGGDDEDTDEPATVGSGFPDL